MGQAFRRASGRIRATASSDATASKTVVDRKPPVSSAAVEEGSKVRELGGSLDSDDTLETKTENVDEEKDPKFDAMLSQMVGRIRTKPGGKLEMGEASVSETYKRPLPKLRNTKSDTSSYEERAAPIGTINIAQLRQMVLLREGKSDGQDGPMEIDQIAEKFRVNAEEVRRVLQFVSIPPEDSKKEKKEF